MKRLAKFVFVLATVCSSCTSRDLDRDTAAGLIESNVEFVKQTNSPRLVNRQNAKDRLMEQGFLGPNLRPTQKAYGIFSSDGWGGVNTVIPLNRKLIGVTGIADAFPNVSDHSSTMKEVQFIWEYSNAQGPIRRFIVRGGTGKALFRLFDDGWRVESLMFDEGEDGFVLTKKEVEEARQDAQAEQERLEKLRIEEAKRQAEELSRKERIGLSRKPTRDGKTYTCMVNDAAFTFYNPLGKPPPLKEHFFQMTDVSVDLLECRAGSSFWFGDINDFENSICKTDSQPPTLPCVTINRHNKILFASETQRDVFYSELAKAVSAWRQKYPDVTGVRASKGVNQNTDKSTLPGLKKPVDDPSKCQISVGPHVVRLTAYQPSRTGTTEYCTYIPGLAPTLLVIDDVGKKLQKMTVGLDVMKTNGERVLHMQPSTLSSGTRNATANFTENGNYIVHVSIVNEGQAIESNIPILVGSKN